VASRRCAAGDRCAEYDLAKRRATLLADPSVPLCPDCLRVAEREVRALPGDYAALEQWLPKPLSQWSDGQPGKRDRGEHPLPLREFVLVLQRTIWQTATAWEPVVRELDRLSDEVTAGVREGRAVQTACTVIAPRLGRLARVGQTDMAEYPWAGADDDLPRMVLHGPERHGVATTTEVCSPTGAGGIAHLRRLHYLARSVVGLTSPVRKLPGACHGCLRDGTLRQHQPRQRGDDPRVWCDQCDAWRPYDEYERSMRLVIWHEGAACS
jgi:hypothetical protein